MSNSNHYFKHFYVMFVNHIFVKNSFEQHMVKTLRLQDRDIKRLLLGQQNFIPP